MSAMNIFIKIKKSDGEKKEKEKISQSKQTYLTEMKLILFPWGENV